MEDIDMADVRLTQLFTNIANAIRNKKGSDGIIKAADFPAEIESIEVGGGSEPTIELERKDVNFYDYDGTLLFAYTLAEAQALTELPTPKGHDGLVFEGWNWDYEDVVALDYPMDIGALYMTDDGKTRLYIELVGKIATDVPLYFGQSIDRGVIIDWGDGSPAETIGGTGKLNTTHHYDALGKYCITLEPIQGCVLTLGSGASLTSTFGAYTNTACGTYTTILYKAEFGAVKLYEYAFIRCTNLEVVTFPNGLGLNWYVFHYCEKLKCAVIPKANLNACRYAFGGCYSLVSCCLSNEPNMPLGMLTTASGLTRLSLVEGMTQVYQDALSGLRSLRYLRMPSSITKIVQYGMRNYISIALDFRAAKQVPTLGGASGIEASETLKIIVPDNLYDEWIAATNWSSKVDNIIKASEYESQI